MNDRKLMDRLWVCPECDALYHGSEHEGVANIAWDMPAECGPCGVVMRLVTEMTTHDYQARVRDAFSDLLGPSKGTAVPDHGPQVRAALERILWAHGDGFASDHDAAIQHGHDVLDGMTARRVVSVGFEASDVDPIEGDKVSTRDGRTGVVRKIRLSSVSLSLKATVDLDEGGFCDFVYDSLRLIEPKPGGEP